MSLSDQQNERCIFLRTMQFKEKRIGKKQSTILHCLPFLEGFSGGRNFGRTMTALLLGSLTQRRR
jgi:hypothetical protein